MSEITNNIAPELLAPAGNWDCARAAVENGANAIYFGLDGGFNARARAENFSVHDLPELMEYLHQHCVKGYVTLNTLVFSDELPEFERAIRHIALADVDAVLVQDLGAARLVKAVCPELQIHASTQMTLTSAACIESAKELGFERVVLPRELTVQEIETVSKNTDMPLEAFVHGALCVAYSGQCLTSESLGGRSANRGQCAQACRLPYDLICDGEDVELGKVKYLLSPQDLAAFELIPNMLRAGVCSFKIEGRLKSAEYVANITRHYRQAIDSAIAGMPVEFSPVQIREMELSFSRGFSHGWLGGIDHKMLVPGLSSAKRGVLLGEVEAVRRQRVSVRLDTPVACGDGVVFAGDRESGDEQGGRVYQIFAPNGAPAKTASSGTVELAFQNDAIDFGRIAPGNQIWKTDDPKLSARLRKTFNGRDSKRRAPLDLQIEAVAGKPMKIIGLAESGARCALETSEPLQVARKHVLTTELLEQQLGRLGGTRYELRSLTANIAGEPMIPLSVLGQLRREMVAQLDSAMLHRPRQVAEGPCLEAIRPELATATQAKQDAQPTLRVLCRSLDQLQATLAAGVESVMVDFQDIREYRQAVQSAHDSGAQIFLATPRIQKPNEFGIFRVLLRHQADGILVRNLSGLSFYAKQGIPTVADFSLNVANELAAEFLIEQGAQRVTASYDLNRDQLLDLVKFVPTDWLEIVIHQHMPMFHMEHCVFCSLLSPGTDKTNCGRPCDDHVVSMRDRIGMEHPLKADVGCRNTLFNAVPQSSAEIVHPLLEQGIRHFRIETLDNTPAEIATIIGLYRDLLDRKIPGKEVWRQLRASNRVGVTRGALEEIRNPLAII